MKPIWLFARSSFGLLALLVVLPELASCSTHDSGASTDSAGSPHSVAGTFGVAATSAAAGLGGTGSVGGASAPSATGAFAQGTAGAGAGAGGANGGSDPGTGLGGSPSTPMGGSSGALSSSSGAGSSGSSNNAGAAGASAAFARVSTLLGKNCGLSGCHADKQSPHFVPGPMLYATLTGGNTVLAECDYAKLVEPGDPSKSALMRLMNRKCGSFTMPPSCNKTTCLSAADLMALSDWIQAGAPP